MKTFLDYLNESMNVLPNKYIRDEIPQSQINYFEKRTRAHIKCVQLIFEFIINNLGNGAQDIINSDISKHDSSKFYSDTYVGYVWITNQSNLGIPLTADQQIEADKAWKKHYETEDHHPEHFSNPNEMTKKNMIEMVSDWTAVAYELNEPFNQFWETKASKKYDFDEEHVNYINELIQLVTKYKNDIKFMLDSEVEFPEK